MKDLIEALKLATADLSQTGQKKTADEIWAGLVQLLISSTSTPFDNAVAKGFAERISRYAATKGFGAQGVLLPPHVSADNVDVSDVQRDAYLSAHEATRNIADWVVREVTEGRMGKNSNLFARVETAAGRGIAASAFADLAADLIAADVARTSLNVAAQYLFDLEKDIECDSETYYRAHTIACEELMRGVDRFANYAQKCISHDAKLQLLRVLALQMAQQQPDTKVS